MDDIINKISRYNLFNNLVPGIVFIVFLSFITPYNIVNTFSENELLLGFLCYFIGSIISRIGSILVEPVLKKVKFVTFAKYNDYLHAKDQDSKIEDLNEENNAYRTYIALFLMLGVSYFIVDIIQYWHIPNTKVLFGVVPILFLLFLFSYKKQTKYIYDRVNKNLNK